MVQTLEFLAGIFVGTVLHGWWSSLSWWARGPVDTGSLATEIQSLREALGARPSHGSNTNWLVWAIALALCLACGYKYLDQHGWAQGSVHVDVKAFAFGPRELPASSDTPAASAAFDALDDLDLDSYVPIR